jgi:hypothetical protein
MSGFYNFDDDNYEHSGFVYNNIILYRILEQFYIQVAMFLYELVLKFGNAHRKQVLALRHSGQIHLRAASSPCVLG